MLNRKQIVGECVDKHDLNVASIFSFIRENYTAVIEGKNKTR